MSVFTDVKTLIDEPGTGVFWPDAVVYDAINEAQTEIWANTKWITTTATLTLTASADLVALPCTIMIPQYYVGSGGKYFITSNPLAENWLREWKKSQTGYPKHLVMWDAEHLRPIPKPDQTYTYTLVGIPWPTEVTALNQDIVGPHELRHAVMFRAGSILLESTLPDLADILMKQSSEEENQLMITLRNQQSDNIRRLRPSTAFYRAQGGAIKVGLRLR